MHIVFIAIDLQSAKHDNKKLLWHTDPFHSTTYYHYLQYSLKLEFFFLNIYSINFCSQSCTYMQ